MDTGSPGGCNGKIYASRGRGGSGFAKPDRMVSRCNVDLTRLQQNSVRRRGCDSPLPFISLSPFHPPPSFVVLPLAPRARREQRAHRRTPLPVIDTTMSSGAKVARHVSPLYGSPLTSVDRLIVPYPRPRRIREHLRNRTCRVVLLATTSPPVARGFFPSRFDSRLRRNFN